MSLFGKIFGGKKEELPSTQAAIQTLNDQEELLLKKQDFLEKKIQENIALAKQYGTKNKRMALQALTRKKQHEKQLQVIDGTMQTIDFQRNALENASMNAEVLRAMGNASKALKAAHDNMDVDKIHVLMEEIFEQQEVDKEVSDAISNPVAFDRGIDETELLAELEALEQEELDIQLLNVGPPAVNVNLPEVPSRELPTPARTKPVAAKADQDKDLEDLEMWANA